MALEPSCGRCPSRGHLLREEYGNLRRGARTPARRIADAPASREPRRRAWLPTLLCLRRCHERDRAGEPERTAQIVTIALKNQRATLLSWNFARLVLGSRPRPARGRGARRRPVRRPGARPWPRTRTTHRALED